MNRSPRGNVYKAHDFVRVTLHPTTLNSEIHTLSRTDGDCMGGYDRWICYISKIEGAVLGE